MNYKTIVDDYQPYNKNWLVNFWCDNYARYLSPFMTMAALKLKIIPNIITLCMIIFGIIGAVLFSLPELWCKILGVVFIHLWYIADESDGEVARITKRFSKYGTDLDFYAHMINHPLFIAAFGWNFIQIGYNTETILVLMFVYVTSELSCRIMLGWDYIHRNEYSAGSNAKITLSNIMWKSYLNLCLFTNVVLLYPIIFLLNHNIAFYVLIFFCFMSCSFMYLKQFKKLYNMIRA